MADLKTTYLGLTLENPIIVGSSGLTRSLERVQECAEAGAGAVVLKSLFEEQIEMDFAGLAERSEASLGHAEAYDYLRSYGRENAVDDYLDVIREAKKSVGIPVIASVHCADAGSWTEFAERVEKAGADALELNVFVLPCDPHRDGGEYEEIYFRIVRDVRARVSLPLALKVGPYFSGLASTFLKLSHAGVDALVLFNRFHRMDLDIENFRVVPGGAFSHPEEMQVPLRWISILSGLLDCDLAATTGVHDGAGVVKHLLAGAAAVQVCSTLYRHDLSHLGRMREEILAWMGRHGFTSVSDFKGKMSQEESENPAAYERVQFMKFSMNAP